MIGKSIDANNSFSKSIFFKIFHLFIYTH
jgi:hypothetical protein